MAISANSSQLGTNNSWLNTIITPEINQQLKQSLTNKELSFNETKEIFLTIAKDGLSYEEQADLNTIWSQNKVIFGDDYTRSITNYIINGNAANTIWWGWLNSDSNKLGNLSTESSEIDIKRLIDKWFSGKDVPLPYVGGDSAAGISGDYKYDYDTVITDTLFDNGVAATDIAQGSAGTCYFLAALGAIAYAQPSIITNGFITDNKDGTYGFRFYNANSEPFYVTVNKDVPVEKSDGASFVALAKTKPTSFVEVVDQKNTELWVVLAEKAYAQLNDQTSVLIRDVAGIPSYQAVEGGWAEPLKQITGLNYSYYSGSFSNIGDPFSLGTKFSDDPATYKKEIINLVNNGAIGWIGSDIDTQDADGKGELVSCHAFMLLGYDSATDTFRIRNPWAPVEGYKSEFSLPLEAFWNGAEIALTDASLKNVDYSYELISNADSEKNAITEGDFVSFQVTRNATGTASIVYYQLRPITTNSNGASLDYADVPKTAINFLSNTINQYLSVPIFTDGVKEGTESFNIELYKSLNDTTPFATLANYIKDGQKDEYTYSLNVDSVSEGEQLIITVTRNDVGSESTVYLDTIDGTAQNYLDFMPLAKHEVVFHSNQKVSTITIDAYSDTQKEETETLGIYLYHYFTDTTPIATNEVFIAEPVNIKDYNYTITSNAMSEDDATEEGSDIIYTVTREGIGTTSSVYLKNGLGAALAGVDYSDNFNKTLTFEPDQSTLRFSIQTFVDRQYEATEILNIDLYKEQVSEMPNATASAFIKNGAPEIYNYAITTTAFDDQTAIEEGGEIEFTITRDGTGSESTIYVDTFDGSALGEEEEWINDYESIYELEIIFAPDETTKSVMVKTYGDSNVSEGTEYLNLGFYQYITDTEYTDYATAYLKDTVPDKYTYSITSGDADEEFTLFEEGEPITFIITRSDKGTPSTVFLWTSEDLATTSDFEALLGQPLTFEADETVKIVTVNTFVDDLTDEPVYEDVFLDLYKYYDDEEYAAYGSAWIASKINEISGTKKADSLVGTDWQDDINGMAGNDKIVGGKNQDVLTGGSGNDTFIYRSILESVPDLADIITDFQKGDKIDLKAIDADINQKNDQAFTKPIIVEEFSGIFTKTKQEV